MCFCCYCRLASLKQVGKSPPVKSTAAATVHRQTDTRRSSSLSASKHLGGGGSRRREGEGEEVKRVLSEHPPPLLPPPPSALLSLSWWGTAEVSSPPHNLSCKDGDSSSSSRSRQSQAIPDSPGLVADSTVLPLRERKREKYSITSYTSTHFTIIIASTVLLFALPTLSLSPSTIALSQLDSSAAQTHTHCKETLFLYFSLLFW